MPTAVPTPVSADSTGLPDSQWITDVRDALRDYPQPVNDTWTADGVGGVFGASSAPVTLSKGPLYDNTPLTSYVAVTDVTSSTNYTVVTTGTPSASQVLLDYNRRTLTWSAPPTSGHSIAVGYYVCKWTDYSIETALYAGVRQMFPSVGKVYVDTSISIQVSQWDYTLPSWAQSPHASISKVEYRDPNVSTEPWRPFNVWTRVGYTTLHLPTAGKLGPSAYLRITGWGPFLSLSDLEPDLYHLPIEYALGVLLPKQETKRVREDTMVPMTQEGGQQPGLLTQTGDYWMKRFQESLHNKSRAYGPPGTGRGILTTYQLRRHV